MLERIAPGIGRLMVRTQAGPLRPLWTLVYRLLVRSLASYLARGSSRPGVYAKGSLAEGSPVYGISDADLILVPARGDAQARARLAARWRALRLRHGLVDRLVDLWVVEKSELEDVVGASFAGYGLGAPPASAAFLGPSPRDPVGLLTRPGLYGPMQDWRRQSGPERLPSLPAPGARERLAFAWLELQFWWWYAFQACADPGRRHVPALCPKLVAEPLRIWLWLVHEERPAGREAVLRRGLELVPEEEPSLRAALHGLRSPRGDGARLLDEAFPAFVRLSRRIAERLLEEASAAGSTAVRLVWDPAGGLALPAGAAQRLATLGSGPRALRPLVDWRSRALALPGLPDETFALLPGDLSSRELVGSAALAGGVDAYPALRAGPLLVLPTAEIWRRTVLRAAQCPLSDPVTFALAEGRATASFPELPGWSVADTARRALAELGAWLRLEPGVDPPRIRGWLGPQPHPAETTTASLGLLFAAARAALLAESLAAGRPELHLTVVAVAQALAERGSEAAAEAADAYWRCRSAGGDPPPRVYEALLPAVRALPAWTDPVAEPGPHLEE